MLKIYDTRKAGGRNEFMEYMLRKRTDTFSTSVIETVREICHNVRVSGDEAVVKYTKKFDSVDIDIKKLRVSPAMLRSREKTISKKLKQTILHAVRNVEAFHKKQLSPGFVEHRLPGGWMGEIFKPIERVGVYIPGGSSALISTIVMTVVPARIAGCPDIILCTPPNRKGNIRKEILAAASVLDVKKVFAIGGAQAIAAMAYGTQTVPQVDFIAGPGNIYVTAAKKIVSDCVGIDSLAGPTEVLIIADEGADPDFIASDMLAQAEHDKSATSLLITTSIKTADKVRKSIKKHLPALKRKEIISSSLKNNGGIVITRGLPDAVRIANDIAPEHLEIMTERPEKILEDIHNAGTVFLGRYTPVTAGDYCAGPNHVLPTARSSRFASPLSVRHFQKRMNVLSLDKESLDKERLLYKEFSRLEKLDAHGKAVDIRLKKNRKKR